MKKSIRAFDPTEIARLELYMWQAYYEHKFLRLFFLLVRLTQTMFGVNLFVASNCAYQAAFAAVIFRLRKGKETLVDEERIRRHLTKFYFLVLKHSIEDFDYKKVANLELRWWLVDRYPDRYETKRDQAIAEATAALYSIDPHRLNAYASFRAKAMELQDESDLTGKTDWEQIDNLLQESYKSLHAAIQ